MIILFPFPLVWQVIEKIRCFWDESSHEYQSRRSSSFVLSQGSSTGLTDSEREFITDDNELDFNDNEIDNTGSRSQSQTQQKMRRKPQRRQSISNKTSLLNEMDKFELDLDNVGMVIDTSSMELESTNRSLYAETVSNVCIVFADIVNFSQISDDMKPIQVLDMLQTLFSKFEVLCDRYGIRKLETIGDTFICTTDMFDKDDLDKDNAKAAASALKVAKKMVREARQVLVPTKSRQTLEIRVGIHVGDLTCGCLGERLPKFTVFGSSVNLAARMKQTCPPNRIRVTKEFFDTIPLTEDWQEKEVISVKNMGQVETYLLNPLK